MYKILYTNDSKFPVEFFGADSLTVLRLKSQDRASIANKEESYTTGILTDVEKEDSLLILEANGVLAYVFQKLKEV